MIYIRAFGKIFAVCVLAAAVCASPAFSQLIPPGPSDTNLGGSNTITGMVLIDGSGRVQRRVAIRLQTMTRGDRTVMTDENGNFAFRQLPPGDYTILIDKEKEFEPYTQLVSVVQPRNFGPQLYNVSIRLKSRASTDAKPSVVNSEFAGVPQAALELFGKATELSKKGDRAGAVELLKEAVALHSEFALAHNDIGVLYLQLGKLDKADESLRAALAIRPELHAANVNRGIVLFQLKRYSDALAPLRAAVTANNDDAVGHYFLGQSLANLGQFREAETELVRAVSLGGARMKEAYRLLAIIYNYSGDKERAAASIEAYLKLAPNAPDAAQLKETLKRLKS